MHVVQRAAVSDVWVSLRSAQFVRQGDQSLFPLRKGGKEYRIRIPMKRKRRSTPICETEYMDDPRFIRKTRATLHSLYGRMSGYTMAMDYFEEVVGMLEDGESLASVGEWSILHCMKAFGIDVDEFLIDSKIAGVVVGDPSAWMRDLTLASGCKVHYTGGVASAKYLDSDDWAKNGLRYVPQNWTPPDYAGDGKLISLSAFDVLARGQDAIDCVKKSLKGVT